MSLEGDLRVRLFLQPGRIQRAEIASTRPDVAQRLLRGRHRAEVQTAVPLLFALSLSLRQIDRTLPTTICLLYISPSPRD